MSTKHLLRLLLAATVYLGFALGFAHAQGITTSAMNGFVTDTKGQPITGATVVIIHEPSGTRAVTSTGSTGQFSMSGLRVGGPYTVTATAGDSKGLPQQEIYLDLDQAATLRITIDRDVVLLEKFSVSGTRDATFDSDKISNNTSYNASEIAGTPMIRRDIQDLAVQDSRLNLVPNTSTGEFQLNAPGQNYRYNSFLVDGVQTNDAFGLNGNGFSSLRSPVPVDAIQALSIDLSPYDVRRSGFTGALLNAVIKSGTNQYHGSAYATYSNQDVRGENPLTHKKDTFRDLTYGATLGGPIIQNKLFFFLAYENFKRTAASPTSTFAPGAALADIIAYAKSKYNYDTGPLSLDSTAEQKTYLTKLDWNISDLHRLSFTYRRTDGTAPIFADNTSSTSISATTQTTSYTASLSNHWYQQPRVTDSFALQLNSNWTPDFRTEATVAYMKYDGSPLNNGAPFPEVLINSVPGTDLSTGAAATGSVRFGTERSRQLNFIGTKTYNGALVGEYSFNNHTLTFGGDAQKDDIANRFVQYILGQYTFANPAAWLTTGIANLRQAYLYPGYTQDQTSAMWAMTNYGLFVQDTWRPNPALTITGGLRLDYPYTEDKPINVDSSTANPTHQPFQTAGFTLPDGRPLTRNDTTNSGNYTIGPRVGFSYKIPMASKRKTQIRGGLGVFQGKNPTVWLSNSYSNAGAIASNAVNNVPFNPTVSLQTAARPQAINVTDPNFKQPVSWKGNLAFDQELPFGLIFTAAVDRAWTIKAPYVMSLNLGAPAAGLSATLPDGRTRYGSVRTTGKAAYSDVLYLTDTTKGGAESYSAALRRPMKNHWGASISYTHTHSTDVSPMTSSVAFSNFSGRTSFNPNEDRASVSNYNTPDKIVMSASREFTFFSRKDANTIFTAVYRGQTGHNYSWVFFNDVNGDGLTGNDVVYMPTQADVDTGKVLFASTAQKDAFFAYAAANHLDKWGGRAIPRNAGISQWQSTIDLHVSQNIPLSGKMKLEIFADLLNFANLVNKSWGIAGDGYIRGVDFPYTRGLVNATVSADGKSYTYTFGNVASLQTYTDLSRWQLQVGARLKF